MGLKCPYSHWKNVKSKSINLNNILCNSCLMYFQLTHITKEQLVIFLPGHIRAPSNEISGQFCVLSPVSVPLEILTMVNEKREVHQHVNQNTTATT